jgi:hypothetical protein
LWLNAVVLPYHHRQRMNSSQSLFEMRFRFCGRCGCRDQRTCIYYQKMYSPRDFQGGYAMPQVSFAKIPVARKINSLQQ